MKGERISELNPRFIIRL